MMPVRSDNYLPNEPHLHALDIVHILSARTSRCTECRYYTAPLNDVYHGRVTIFL